MKSWQRTSARFSLALLTVGILVLPVMAHAMVNIDPPTEYVGNNINYTLEQPFGGVSSVASFAVYLQLVYQFGLGIIGIMATVLIMFGGVRWISAAGNESIIGEAKEIIIAAVTGLTIALLSYIILLIINPQLVNISLNLLKIPVAANNTAVACATDSPLTEATGAKYCATYGGTVVPSLSATDLNKYITDYNTQFGAGLSLTFIKAIMQQESAGWCINARSTYVRSSTGVTEHACGLMQVLPSTAKGMAADCSLSTECGGVLSDADTDATATKCCDAIRSNPKAAICLGVDYLSKLKKEKAPYATNGDETLMAAGYNGGAGCLVDYTAKCGVEHMYECTAITNYQQTRDYVVKVAAHKAELCAANTGGGCVTNTTTSKADNAYCETAASGSTPASYSYATCTNSAPVCTSPASMVNPGTCGAKTSNHYSITASTSVPACVAN